MPILSYFAVVGSVLVALLFVADARLDKHPLPYSSEFVALPKAAQPQPPSSILTATPAPAPDMTSAAVLAAAPPPPSSAELAAAALTAKAEADPERTAKVETVPKKPKRVARRSMPYDDRQNYAWRNDGSPFGGGNAIFGRF